MPPTIAEIKELNCEAGLDISSLRAGPFGPVWVDALPPDTTLWGTQPGGFGQTEVSGLAVLNAYGGPGLGNSGRPSPLAQVRVVDPEGRECAVGEPGEIVVRGDLVHAGYWNRPELNAARMRNGWWHTTDLGRREADGTAALHRHHDPDDQVGGREHLPARGRGLPREPPRRAGGRADRRARPDVPAVGQGRGGAGPRRDRRPRRSSSSTAGPASRRTRSRGASSSSRRCRAGPESRTTTRSTRPSEAGGIPVATTSESWTTSS